MLRHIHIERSGDSWLVRGYNNKTVELRSKVEAIKAANELRDRYLFSEGADKVHIIDHRVDGSQSTSAYGTELKVLKLKE